MPRPTPNAVQRRIDSADALVRVCPELEENNRGAADPRSTAEHLIDLSPASVRVGSTVFAPASARDVLEHLTEALGTVSPAPAASHRPPLVRNPFVPRGDNPVSQDSLIEGLTSYLEPGDTLVVDFGTAPVFGLLDLPVPIRILQQSTWKAIGYSTPAVVGAQLADRTRRFLQIVGDGAFHENGQEIATAIRHGLTPITIVINNSEYLVENLTHADPPASMSYNTVHPWDHSRFPALMDGDGKSFAARVTTEQELAWALDGAFTAHGEGRYSLIEVVTSPTDVSAAFTDFLGLPRLTTRKA